MAGACQNGRRNTSQCLKNPVVHWGNIVRDRRNLSHTNRSTDSRLVVSLRLKTHLGQFSDDYRLCPHILSGPVAGLEAQERDLRAAGCDKILREQVSSVAERQQLEAALDYVREHDQFAVTKLDRLARSVGDLLTIVARLEAKKVSLRVLSISGNQTLDTSTSTGRLMLSVIGAVGQAEREAMLERQREGIAKAKREGRYKGRVPTARRRSAEIIRLMSEGVRPSEIASNLGIGRASVYRVLGSQRHDGAR